MLTIRINFIDIGCIRQVARVPSPPLDGVRSPYRHKVHLLRDAADHLDRKADAEALTELYWLYGRAYVAEAIKDISALIEPWAKKAPRLVGWVDSSIYDSPSF